MLLSRLASLRHAGYDAVQISPAQKSPPGHEWYLRYQPFDHLKIEGLGSRQDLTNLCDAATRLGLVIVADLVFNHMAVPQGLRRSDWQAADLLRQQGDSTAIEKLYQHLLIFPHLTLDDFEPWHDMQGENWDNEYRYESWGNGEWPELRATANVISLHKKHLAILYECGVRGFRFDAVKHMRPQHLSQYIAEISTFGDTCWSYGEVFSGEKSMHDEYANLFPTTDFPFILHLKKLLETHDEFQLDPLDAFLSPNSIRFGTNHDLICNPKHLIAGLLFRDTAETRLANCLSLLLDGGTTLVLASENDQDPLIRACVLRRHALGTLKGKVSISKSDSGWTIKSSQSELNLDLKSQCLRL